MLLQTKGERQAFWTGSRVMSQFIAHDIMAPAGMPQTLDEDIITESSKKLRQLARAMTVAFQTNQEPVTTTSTSLLYNGPIQGLLSALQGCFFTLIA